MPHATSPNPGFQALILCGPGQNLLPFNSNPKDFPKALIPIANRPMVWYPLEWCHLMGISNITLVTPPECSAAIEAALSQNPYLTSLPSPRPTLLAPQDLTLNTGTAELLRLKEVQHAIMGDFIVLPCDLVCEMPGTSLLDTWMTLQGRLSGENDAVRQGGLGVWYDTKDANEGGVGVKKEETDFLATTTPVMPSAVPPPVESLLPFVRDVRMAMPTGTLDDELEDNKGLHVRARLLRDFGSVRMHVKHRDAHIYLFPHWAKEYIRLNDTFDSIGEDVLGWWAKAGWQNGLAQKLHMDDAMRPTKRRRSEPAAEDPLFKGVYDLANLSSTVASDFSNIDESEAVSETPELASRVQPVAYVSSAQASAIPGITAYMHKAHFVPSASVENSNQKQKQPKSQSSKDGPVAPQQEAPSSLIRRVDTVPLLLSASLYLARLGTMLDALPGGAPAHRARHPFLPVQQIHPSSALPGQATVHAASVLIDANVALQPRITIRDSVIGAGCSVASGARIHGCLLMDGVVVEERAVLSGCVIGRRCRVGREADLKDCIAQEGYAIAEGTKAKGEVMAGFSGGDDEMDEDGEGADGLDLMA